MLRQPQIDLNRKELAARAGVTPALVTYYFHDQSSLIEAVAQPVVERYLQELDVLVQGKAPAARTLHAVVRLLLRIGRENGRLLDGYVEYAKRTSSTRVEFLGRADQALGQLFGQCEAEGLFRALNVPLAQTMLWGACKMVAQTTALTDMLTADIAGAGPPDDAIATLVVDLLLRGFGPPPPPPPPRRRGAPRG